jgi:hypothetical protein
MHDKHSALLDGQAPEPAFELVAVGQLSGGIPRRRCRDREHANLHHAAAAPL